MDSKELKMLVKPTEVAIRYLGTPLKERYGKLWYKSPFRNERTASFVVSDKKGFHDFGDSWHGDILSFVERLFNIRLRRLH